MDFDLNIISFCMLRRKKMSQNDFCPTVFGKDPLRTWIYSKLGYGGLEVGEIFTEAGAAFNKLAEMTMMLHPMPELQPSTQSKTPIKKKVQEERVGTINNSGGSGQVTLNMLNASESEMDVEGLGSDVKLEFESSAEEVTT